MMDNNIVRDESNKKTLLIFGLTMAAAELIKQLLLTFITGKGIYLWWYFPWQLCSIPMYVSIIAGTCRSRRIYDACISFLSCFALLSGICAFLDTSGFEYELFILTIHSYCWHIALIGISIYSWYIRYKASGHSFRFTGGVLIYLTGCAIAELINILAFDNGLKPINMFYISPRYVMGQVYIRDLVPVLGNNACILLYAAVTISGALIIDIIGKKIIENLFSLRKQRLNRCRKDHI